MTRTIYRERIPSTSPRLNRHVLHDSWSRLYPFPTGGLSIASVEHRRILAILDQGNAGSCTADCGTGIMGTAPYAGDATTAAFVKAFGSFDQAGAYRLYDAEERADGGAGYPPEDEGSTGLTLAKVLRAKGLISGWQQTFLLDDALKALTVYPLALGTVWLNSMFDVLSTGVLSVARSSGVAGGHEYEAVGYDANRGLVKVANSWGTGWGLDGYAYLQAEDLGWLLDRQGDVTVFTPASQPAPTPTPSPADPYATWRAIAYPWARGRHTSIAGNSRMAAATRTYIAATDSGQA